MQKDTRLRWHIAVFTTRCQTSYRYFRADIEMRFWCLILRPNSDAVKKFYSRLRKLLCANSRKQRKFVR